MVLRQEFRFSPGQWISRLPDPVLWPRELDSLPKTADGQQLIDRNTVFQVGRRATDPLGAGRALLASVVWGTGTAARERTRRLRVFHPPAGEICDQLAGAIEVLRSDGAEAAYTHLHGHGRNIIKHLGPSFGTKLLYFCGYDSSPGIFKPLILDKYVAGAINRLCGLSWPDTRFSPSQYHHYLELAHFWASSWNTSPDVIERVLFSVGKASPLAVGALSGATCL
jgi:hypothetical protein